MQVEKWARAKPGTHGLRRGAWYPVVNEAVNSMVVLDVRKNNVPVPRDMLVLLDGPPSTWTVVQWHESERGAQRASEEILGLTYAVCPACHARARLIPPDAERLTCPECQGSFDVNWNDIG